MVKSRFALLSDSHRRKREGKKATLRFLVSPINERKGRKSTNPHLFSRRRREDPLPGGEEKKRAGTSDFPTPFFP